MNDLLRNLLQIQAIDFANRVSKDDEVQRTTLRGLIPQQILGHYDRLVARGKKGVAVVRNQTCGGCHMRIPIGAINTLLQAHDIQLCDSCGRYLYLPGAEETHLLEPATAAKPARKPRKKKTPLEHATA